MKVIRHRIPALRRDRPLILPAISRPPTVPEDSQAEPPKPKRKALLIGISYKKSSQVRDGNETNSDAPLKGPHRDVLNMKQLLIDRYGYLEKDIVVLMDTEEPGQVLPTRLNIIEKMKELVYDAQSDDKFFFHYAGHSIQLDTNNPKEEDGKDECLYVLNDEQIQDDELQELLVKPLPIGASLWAVFDSCHSASLLGTDLSGPEIPPLLLLIDIGARHLDLDHFRCNRVYVPWISKGRRKTDTQWNANVRRHAVDFSSRRVYRSTRINTSAFQWKKTSIDQILYSPIDLPADYKKLSVTKTKTKTLPLMMDPNEHWFDTTGMPIQRCSSPIETVCGGWCQPPPTDSVQHEPDVVSLAASKDYQRSWEDSNGDSMTQALIRVLSDDPHPVLGDMLKRVSHNMHKLYLRLHGQAREYKREFKAYNNQLKSKGKDPGRALSVEMNNFQDPQISSPRPLDMRNKRWDP